MSRVVEMPLHGVRVLDLSRLLPGPFATMVLAGLGAEVVKVEDLDGGDQLRWMGGADGGVSPMFTALNAGKRSVRLDLKSARGRELFLAMAERADVILEGFRPGVMERLELGHAALQQRNPRVILCSLTGYGQDGPDRDRAGHDLNYLARSGILSITGNADGTPAIPGVQVGDFGGGGLGAVIAILAALRVRERTGRGSWCDVAMLDGLLAWMTPNLAATPEGNATGPGHMPLNGAYPCYRIYRCADGWMTVAALEPKFWTRLCEMLGADDLRDRAFASGADGAAVAARLEALLLARTRVGWREFFADADVCCEPVLSPWEAADDPQARHRATPGLRASWFPVRVGEVGQSPLGPAPDLGADSRAVLAEMGVSDAEFDELVAQRVTA